MRSDVADFEEREEAIHPQAKTWRVYERAALTRADVFGMVYGSKTFWWPVSSGWLRSHGYPTRRVRQWYKVWKERMLKCRAERR